ncbi:MAG TPA: arginine decarboxylase, partial [Syntrophomonas sp.]|nr:arginine decarboxylase [Syntrophomonas sp.]
DKSDWERFYKVLQEVAADYAGSKKRSLRIEPPPAAKVVLSPRRAFKSAKKQVKLAESLNLISGEMIAVYPPGIPCLLPGECITGEVLNYLHHVIDSGARIQGPEEPTLNNILVID